MAALQPAVRLGVGQGHRDRRRDAVAVVREDVDDPFLGEAVARQGGQAVPRRLVRHHQVDVVGPQARLGPQLVEQLPHAPSGQAVDARPLHVEQVVARDGGGVVGVLHDPSAAELGELGTLGKRAHAVGQQCAPLPGWCGLDHCGTGSVS